MAYMHIANLYKDQRILLFRRCYALEKIHGTSAHVSIKADGAVSFFSGGAKHEQFCALFNEERLLEPGLTDLVVFGEACGGKIQGMRGTYGGEMRFVAFEVKIGETWLSVPNAAYVAGKLGLSFVDFREVDATVEALDAERDRPSSLALSLGLGENMREGIVARPLVEVRFSNGDRCIVKHKRDEFRETRSPRQVGVDSLVLEQAEQIALEWVTEQRLSHVVDKLGPVGLEQTGDVIRAVVADVEREAAREVAWSKSARKAVGKMAAKMWRARCTRLT
jgi:hypothetical protein